MVLVPAATGLVPSSGSVLGLVLNGSGTALGQHGAGPTGHAAREKALRTIGHFHRCVWMDF